MPESAIQELLDKQALNELVVRWCRAIDRCDEELLRSTYHDDAIDEHGPFVGSGAAFVEHTKLHGSMNLEKRPGPVQHSVTNTLFEVDGDVAYGECYVEVRTVQDGHLARAVARYVDRFERRSGEWRIAHRRVVLESATAGYGVAAFTPGFRDRRDPSYERVGFTTFCEVQPARTQPARGAGC